MGEEKLLNGAANNNDDKNEKEEMEIVDDDLLCGLGSCRPAWLQRCNNIKLFMFVISIFSITQGMLVNGVVTAGLPTIEKEFGLRSTSSGIIVAGNDISSLLLVGVVSFFGTKGHKPKWIGYGGLLTGIGALIFALPKLIIGNYEPAKASGETLLTCQLNGTAPDACVTPSGGKHLYVFIFVLAELLMGAGTTPLYTLGTAYVDENVAPESTPIYLGIWFLVSICGRGVGFIILASFLRIFTDIEQPEGMNMTQKDPRWVGAWWLASVVFSIFLFLSFILLIMFPKEMVEGKKKRQKAIAEGKIPGADQQMEYNLKGMLRTTYKLVTNKTFIFAVLGLTIKTLLGVGLGAFFTKLIILKFGASPSKAGVIVGASLIPGMFSGIVVGTFIMRKIAVKGAAKKAAFICFVVGLLTLLSSFIWVIPGCKNTNMAGMAQAYHNHSSIGSVDSQCNNQCTCSRAKYLPVCGSDGVTYFNPCYAGCTVTIPPMGKGQFPSFGNCGCFPKVPKNMTGKASSRVVRKAPGPPGKMIPGKIPTKEQIQKMKDSLYNTATFGKCDRDCKNLGTFIGCFIVLIFFAFIPGTPHKMLVLRSVPDNQRSFALGMSFFVMRTLSFLPGPIILGAVIDGKCTLWGYDKCGQRQNCLDYDVDALSWNIVMFGVITSVLATIFYGLSWWCYVPLEGEVKEDGDEMNNMLSADA